MSQGLVIHNEWERFKWQYNANMDRLCITVITTNGVYNGPTLLSRSNLCDDFPGECGFTRDDIACFKEFRESFSDFPFSDDEKCLLAYNAVATRRFHKKLNPVDHLFKSCGRGRAPEIGEVVIAVPNYTRAGGRSSEGDFVVVENDKLTNTCYLMQISNSPLLIGVDKLNREVNLHTCSCIRLSYDYLIKISALNESLIKTLNIA